MKPKVRLFSIGELYRAGTSCVVAGLLMLSGPALAAGYGANDGAPAGASAAGIGALKAAPADRSRIEPLRDALLGFDRDGAANGGAAPSNAGQRIAEMRRLAGPAKQAIREFVKRIEGEGEAAQFDALVERKVRELNAPDVLAELQRAGGAMALLGRGDETIDEMIADRSKVADQRAEALIMRLLGINAAHAGLRSGTCALFWYTISLGYGTAYAYRSCYY